MAGDRLGSGSAGWPSHLPVGVLRVVRWSRNYEQSVRFYRDVVGLPELETFTESYGLDGTILGLPSVPVHLEIVRLTEPAGPGSAHDELVLYLPDRAAQQLLADRLAAAGFHPIAQLAYWEDHGGMTFADPDGHHLILAPWLYAPG